MLGCGALTLVQTWWYEPRSMARVRARVAQRGDSSKFDAYLGSRRYRVFRWIGLAGGAIMAVIGVMVLSGAV